MKENKTFTKKNISDDAGQESESVSSQLRRVIKTSVILLASLSIFTFTVWAWFASNGKITPTGAMVSIAESQVELACAVKNDSRHSLIDLVSGNNRTIKTYYNCKPGENNTMQITGEAIKQDLNLLTTDRNQTIHWYLDNAESDFKDQSAEYLFEPGTHGQLVFYLVLNREADTIPCNIQLTGYTLDEEGDITIWRDVAEETPGDGQTDDQDTEAEFQVELLTDEKTKGILQHHILFFGEYDEENKLYSNWLSDGTFSVDMSSVKPGEAVKVTLYWVWPSYFDEYIGGERTTFCAEDGDDYIAIRNTIIQHPEYYFSNTGNDITINSDLMNADQLDNARLAYNTADSDIGSSVHFVQATISIN